MKLGGIRLSELILITNFINDIQNGACVVHVELYRLRFDLELPLAAVEPYFGKLVFFGDTVDGEVATI